MGAAGEPPPGKETKVMRNVRRATVLILLGLTLGTPWAGASPLRLTGPTPHRVLDYLGGLLASLWLKTGCIMDPNGRCAPGAPTQGTDGGCTVDPLGRCIPRTQNPSTDEGCTMDPLGRCAPGH
jgi:hypothetical protein